jgi:hypothetical protein
VAMAEANAATATTTAAFIRTFCLCLFVWSQRCDDIDIHPHTNAHFPSVSSCGHRGATTSTFIRIQTHILRLSLRVVTEVQRHLHSSAFKRTVCLCLFLWTEEQRQLHSFIRTLKGTRKRVFLFFALWFRAIFLLLKIIYIYIYIYIYWSHGAVGFEFIFLFFYFYSKSSFG